MVLLIEIPLDVEHGVRELIWWTDDLVGRRVYCSRPWCSDSVPFEFFVIWLLIVPLFVIQVLINRFLRIRFCILRISIINKEFWMLVVLVQINFATLAGKVSVVRWSADRNRLSGTTEKVAKLMSLE